MSPPCAHALLNRCTAASSRAFRCRHPRVDGLERPSGRTASPSGNPITIMSPARSQPGSWTEISTGTRAHNKHPRQRAHAPPNSTTPVTPLNRGLTARRRTSKRVSNYFSLRT